MHKTTSELVKLRTTEVSMVVVEWLVLLIQIMSSIEFSINPIRGYVTDCLPGPQAFMPRHYAFQNVGEVARCIYL